MQLQECLPHENPFKKRLSFYQTIQLIINATDHSINDLNDQFMTFNDIIN